MDAVGPSEAGAGATRAVLERVDLELPSTLGCINQVEEAAAAIALRAGFDPDDADNLAMAAREAVVNAVKHANGFNPEKIVTAALERSADGITFRIADQGKGFDASALPDPLQPENLLRDSGRGVFLMRAIMDEVNFRQLNPGTEVTLIKHKNVEAGS